MPARKRRAVRTQWRTEPPPAATSPMDDVVQVTVTSTSGSHGIRFNDSQLGHLNIVSSVLPGDFCLDAVNVVPLRDFAMCPNQGIIEQLTNLATPFELTFTRCKDHEQTSSTTWRAWMDGGARRSDVKASIGLHGAPNESLLTSAGRYERIALYIRGNGGLLYQAFYNGIGGVKELINRFNCVWREGGY